MKTSIRALITAIAILSTTVFAFADTSQPPLTSFDFNIVGFELKASPDYQAVPKGIASKVNASFETAGFNLADLVAQLPKDYTVRAELSGPAFQTPVSLTTKPGTAFDLPTLALTGRYSLSNIRLVDGNGTTLFGAIPQIVAIESIPDPLITTVTTRQLTVQELQDRGVTFDNSNFTAYEFTAGIATSSGQVPITLPVIIPTKAIDLNTEEIPKPGIYGLDMSMINNPPPNHSLFQDFSVSGFMMGTDEEKDEEGEDKLPPIPGVIVIPGNIGFLHQYFSAMAVITNGAPKQSNLVVKDIKVKIILPSGEDLQPGTDAVSGDDPLRMAKGQNGFFPREMVAMNPGPDGKSGTSDDTSSLKPSESGQADFTIEGLKEGTHKLDFEITATLEGLPIGPVTIKGKATGAVLVRNPDFSITMGHPATIRSGEAYDLFITVTNTGKSVANLVSVHLDQRALSGVVFAQGEEPDKHIETILPGSSETVKFRLVSQRTGKVTATVFESPEMKGRFILRAGVGENNIPLSPDSLILPYVGDFPPDLVNSAVGLLGQAWSVATAPRAALPSDVLPISKHTVSLRANDLSEAGLRVLMGDTKLNAVEELAFDYLGSNNADKGFDDLRRRSTQGLNFNRAMAAIFQQEVLATDLFAFQAGLADKVSYRPPHISVITSDAPVRLRISDASGRKTGGLAPNEALRGIPYADQLLLSDSGSSRSTLSLITNLESTEYRLELVADADASLDLGIVLVDTNGVLQQVKFSGLNLPIGAKASMLLKSVDNGTCTLDVDTNGDGIADLNIAASSLTPITENGPQVVAATQIGPGFGPGGDRHGRNVAILFSKKVTKESAQDLQNYSIEGNEVKASILQSSGRMAFIFLRDGIGPFFNRSITISGISDERGNLQPTSTTLPIKITAKGPAAYLNGTVRTAKGEAIPGAVVQLVQDGGSVVGEKIADANGRFQFDYVFRNELGYSFRIIAKNPTNNDLGSLSGNVLFHGQQFNIDIFMKARGSVSGTVRDVAGNAIANAAVLITTLNDNRQYAVNTDGSGAFSFNDICVGPFNLKSVSKTAFAEGTIMGVLPDDGSSVVQDIVIYRPTDVKKGNVIGRVLASDGVTPRPGIVVVVSAPLYTNWMYSGADGSYAFNGVFAGAATVTAQDMISGDRSMASGTVTEGVTSAFNLILKGTGTVVGQVQRGDGKSPAGMIVVAYVNNIQRVAQADAAGGFRLEGLPVGEIDIHVLDPTNYNPTVSGKVSLSTAGDTANIFLYIPEEVLSLGSIKGKVYRLNGSAAPNAVVRLVEFGNSTYRYVTANSVGEYLIENLPIGTYYLVVVNGKEITNAKVTLWHSGQIAMVDLHPVGFGTITGTIYDAGTEKKPVGADVMLVSTKPDKSGWLVYDSSNPTMLKSDPQTGRYTFSNVYLGDFSVGASNEFRPTRVTQKGVISENGQKATVDLTLQDSFGSISGKVLKPDGTPAGEGVRLTVRFGGDDVTVTTDSTGKFAFYPIIPAGMYMLKAEDQGPQTTLKWQGGVSVVAGRDIPVDVKLLGKGSIKVLVVDSYGEPVVGAEVDVVGSDYPNDSSSGLITGPDGAIIIANLSEGNYTVSAKNNVNLAGRNQVKIPADNASVTVTVKLAEYGKVTGKFFKADGVTPIAGGEIKLLKSGRVYAYTSTSSLGEFSFDFITTGDFALEGFDPVSLRQGMGGGRLTANGETASANVVVIPRGTVKGVVLNNSGSAPIFNAVVRIVGSGNTGYSFDTVTGADGSYIFTYVPSGRFTITTNDPFNKMPGQATGTISYEGETVLVDVHIVPTGSIKGRVLMPDGITQTVNATVSIQYSPAISTIDSQTGEFLFNNLAAGRSYTLVAVETNTNRAGKTIATISGDGAIVTADVTLRGVGTVQGTIFDNDGTTPLAGAAVRLYGGDLAPINKTDFTGPDGTYKFIDVPAGKFTLQTNHQQRTTAAAASGYLNNEGEVVTVNMTIGPVASITGKVFMADGVTPARGGGVRYVGNGKAFIAVIDTDGLFLIQNIPILVSSQNVPIPFEFSLEIDDAVGIGIAKYKGMLSSNLDIGTIVLDDKPITVSDVNPADGSVIVPVTQIIKILFSEPADQTTITSSSVYLTQGSNRIAAALQFDTDFKGITLTPSAPLSSFTSYTLVVTTEVKDRVGRALPQNFTASYTTLDNTPPTVKSVSPSSGAIEVASDGVVRITFSESIDPAYVSEIKLLQGNTQVSTQLDLIQSGTIAVLTPISPLAVNSTYNVSVSNVRDMIGNIQQGTSLTSFATIDTIAPTISSLTVPANADLIKGNTVVVTAVSPDMDVAFVDFYLDGIPTATDTTAPYTMNLLLAKEGSVQVKAVAQDRAGNRWLPVSLDLNVTADQPPTVTFTAPAEGSTVNTGSTVTVTVQGQDDLTVKEITLTASGETSFTKTLTNNTGKSFTANFTLPIPTAITQGGSILLSAVAKDLGGNLSPIVQRTLIVKDTTPPGAVSLVSPGQTVKYRPGDSGTATFNATDNVGVATITCSATGAAVANRTYTISPAQTSVSQVFDFTVAANAVANAYIQIYCTAYDAAGNQAAGAINLTVADVIPPQVTSASLANNAIDVPIGSSITLLFSKPVTASTAVADNIYLTDANGQRVPASITLASDRKGIVLQPQSQLVRGANYTFTATSAIADDAGNLLQTPYVVTFTTDNSAPLLKSVSPANGTTNVPIGSAISFTFNEAIDQASIGSNSIVVTSGFGPVAGNISLSSDKLSVVFKPSGQLSFNRNYTVTFNANVADISGNTVAINYSGAFLTQSPSSDLVCLLSMDGDWSDSSGSANHGTANGSVTFSSDHIGGTMSGNFDGVNDYIRVNNATSLNPSTVTVEAWAKSTTPVWNSPGSIVSKVYGYVLRPVEGSKEIVFTVWPGGTEKSVSVNDPELDITQWHHYAATADGSSIKLYIDGVLKNTVYYNGTLYTTYTGNLSIGQDDWQTSRYFKGLIDEVAIYKQALPAEDIFEHFNAALTSDRLPPAQPTVNPVASPTNLNNVVLSGTKEADSSIRVNGRQVVAHDASNVWQALYSLQPGQNILDITSRDQAGNASDPVTISVELSPASQRDPDIAGLWHLDENWLDYSGNGNNGTANNGARFSADRIEGGAAGSLDGTNDYISIADSATLHQISTMSVESWIKPNDISLAHQIISKFGAYGDYTYRLSLAPTGQIRFEISGDGTAIDSLVSTNAPIVQNKWQHVAATYNAGALKLYVNGVEVASKVSTITSIRAGTSPLNFGRDLSYAQYFNGLIDEIVLYKRALTSEEIQSHYTVLPNVSLTSPGQTTKYLPGEAGTAIVVADHPSGITGLTCTASGAGQGMINPTYGSPQTTVTESLAFQVTANASPYATVTLTCSAVDAAGHIGTSSINLTVADVVTPTVRGASITDNAVNVAATKPITVTFYEAMASATVNTLSVTLMTDDGTNQQVSGTVTLSSDLKSITFTQASALEGNTPYRLTISTAVTDLAGNPLSSDYILHFTIQPVTAVTVSGKGTSSVPFVVAAGRYSTISITSSYVVFDGPVAADSLSLATGSVLTQLQTGLLGAERLEISAVNITIDSTSKIDVSGKGYLGGRQVGNSSDTGMTKVGNNGSTTLNGGSYGGLGGITSTTSGSVNISYGNLMLPDEPGSGGGGNGSSWLGGNGGGLVKITAGTLNLAGGILADGGATVYSGSGSGGGVLINTGSISGNGTISAQGGSATGGTSYGSGGGGRIAIYYNTNTLPTGNIVASGGKSGTGSNTDRNGGAGTIYLKDNAKAKADLIINNGGIVTGNITAVPGADYGLVDVKGGAAITVKGSLTTDTDLTLNNSTLTSNGSLKVTGNITLQNQSVVNHTAATASKSWMLDITASTISIDSTSKIDVSGRGYLGGRQIGNDSDTGMTKVGNNGSTTLNGGSYGGLGGITSTTSGSVNISYGNLMLPDEPGSGGGGNGSSWLGGNGGGLVKITAGTLNLAGEILANGGATIYSGSGSGGGVLINTGSISGNGTISAQGGSATGGTSYGSGGGGRIAIYYNTNTLPTGNIVASGGKSGDGSILVRNGGAGTIYIKDNAKTKADLIINNGGILTSNITVVPGADYGLVDVKGGAAISMNGSFTTDSDMVMTNTQLTVTGSFSIPNLTMNNSTLTSNGSLKVTGNITLQNQSVVTHSAATATESWMLDLTASTISIDSTSKIDVSGKGYLGGRQVGNDSDTGMTKVGNNGSTTLNGGSYGGLGGITSTTSGSVNISYGNLMLPDEPGSGGGGNGSSWLGGNGGGLVKITAGTLNLAGGILADGGATVYSGSGSGGGVLINTGSISGNGTISAQGGSATGGTSYGSGGGGRIAIYYNTNTLPTGNIVASGGKSGTGSNTDRNGGAGTIYLKDNAKANGDMVLDNHGIDSRENSTQIKSLGRDVISIITSDSLIKTGANWINGVFIGFKLNPNVNQKLFFTVKDNNADTIFINPADGNLNSVAAVGDTYSGAFVFNTIKALGKSRLYCNEQLFVDKELIVDDSTLVTNELYAERVLLQNGGSLSHPSTTTTNSYKLTLGVNADLTIDSTSKIDVSGRGYLGGRQVGNDSDTGMTKVGNNGSTTLNGGSYGGLGGITSTTSGSVNISYGNLMLPDEPGSGGGGNGSSWLGGNGGGLVKITTGTLNLAGGILADGGATVYSGSGSGGGVLINTGSISGNGTISAQGGSATGGTSYGSGGGGRIAIYYHTNTLPNDNVVASGGKSGNGSITTRNGGNGTVYFSLLP